MKAILAVAISGLITLLLEEKAREVAGGAQAVYGETVAQARDATGALKTNVQGNPLSSILISGGLGFAVAYMWPKKS